VSAAFAAQIRNRDS